MKIAVTGDAAGLGKAIAEVGKPRKKWRRR
jgi:hypothetical protein